jgi:hypothetical protein
LFDWINNLFRRRQDHEVSKPIEAAIVTAPKYDLGVARSLFDRAQLHVAFTPQLNGSLANACDTVSFGMMCEARKAFATSVELVVGGVTLDGNADYSFTAADLQGWLNRSISPPAKFPGHAWLEVDGDILDFTLWSTYNKHLATDKRFSNPSFFTRELALQKGIKYIELGRGDDVLMPFFKRMSC